MGKSKNRKRWIWVVILFFFLLFQHFDFRMLVSVAPEILSEFNIRWSGLDPITVISLLAGLIFFFVWGYFYDSHTRKYLISLAGFIWGVSSWLIGIAPTSTTFFASIAVGGIDNASYSGIYVLIGDLFTPRNRGKILGLIHISQPLSLLLGILFVRWLGQPANWRMILFFTGALGILMTFIVYFGLREPKRGANEPALAEIRMSGVYLFDWKTAKDVLTSPGLMLIYAFGLFGGIPWFVLTTYLGSYLRESRAVAPENIYQILLPPLIALTLGSPLGGWLGDRLSRLRRDGRILISIAGVVLPGLFLYIAIKTQEFQPLQFTFLMSLMGIYMSFYWPNMVASIFDITLPEFRASATSIMLFFQVLGSLLGNGLISLMQNRVGLEVALLWICLSAWAACLIILVGLLKLVSNEIEELRRHMAYRSHLESRLQLPTEY